MMESSMSATGEVSATGMAFLFGAILIPLILFVVVSYVVFAIFLGMIFKKAGVPSWKAWIPIYNSWIFLELGGQKGFWAPLALIPFVNLVSLVFMIIAAHNIGQNLGKETWFVLLYIFVGYLWVIWLALDKSTWQPKGATPSPGFTPPFQGPNPTGNEPPLSAPAPDAPTPSSQPESSQPIPSAPSQPVSPDSQAPSVTPFSPEMTQTPPAPQPQSGESSQPKPPIPPNPPLVQ